MEVNEWNRNEQKKKILHDSWQFYEDLISGEFRQSIWRIEFLTLNPNFIEKVKKPKQINY